jgi:hypothetical protein
VISSGSRSARYRIAPNFKIAALVMAALQYFERLRPANYNIVDVALCVGTNRVEKSWLRH